MDTKCVQNVSTTKAPDLNEVQGLVSCQRDAEVSDLRDIELLPLFSHPWPRDMRTS